MIIGNAISTMEAPVTKDVKSVAFVTASDLDDQTLSQCVRCGMCREVCPEKIYPDLKKGDATVILYAVWERSYLPGDINGDGTVNNKDVTRLMRYIKYKDVEVVKAALDVNGDGTVNNKDVTRLMRYVKYKDVEIH